MSERMSKDMSERMSEDLSEDMSEWMSKDMSERMSKDMSKRMSKDMSERMSKRMSERMSRDMSERMSERYVRKNVRKICQKECQKDMSERMSERMSKDMSEDMSERVSKDMSERMSENMSDRMSEDVRYGSPGKCLWVMLHKTNNFAIGNATKLMLCHLMWRTAANTCGSTFRMQASEVGLAAMSELVVGRRATIFIGTSSRFAKGVGYVWRYVLTTVGPERIYVCMEPPSTTHAGDCMLCHRLWMDLCGMWCMKGELFQMSRASKSWSSVLQSFELGRPFGRLECMSGKPMLCPAGPVTPKRCKRHSGKHLTSWFAHAMRCSCGCVLTCMASWDSTAFLAGLSVCVCVLLQALCIFGLNCFLAGLSDAIESNCRIAIWQTQSCHGYYFCCVVWGKYRVCGVAFVWSCGCYVLSLICQKNVRRYVRKHVKRYVRKNVRKICQKKCQKICQKECQKICQKECQKICQKICQKECQKICQKERQKIASSPSAKLRVTERISGDELYVYPHLTRSGWHKI